MGLDSWSQGLASPDGAGGPERPHRPRTEGSGRGAPHSQRGDPEETRARARALAPGPRWDGPRAPRLPRRPGRGNARERAAHFPQAGKSVAEGDKATGSRGQQDAAPPPGVASAASALTLLGAGPGARPPRAPPLRPGARGRRRPSRGAQQRGRRTRAPACPPARPPQPGSPAAPRPRAPGAGDGRWKEETLR